MVPFKKKTLSEDAVLPDVCKEFLAWVQFALYHYGLFFSFSEPEINARG